MARSISPMSVSTRIAPPCSARSEPNSAPLRGTSLFQIRILTAAVGAVLACLLLSLTNSGAEPWTFDPQAYDSLVDADSPQAIPPGTRINSTNWQQYRHFLPIGIQALFSHSYQWSVPTGPDGEIVVGPTVRVSQPYKYRLDTEKYAGRTKLLHNPDGSVGISGYVAGLPFPQLDRRDPDLVSKLIYNSYFRYHPAILFYRQRGLLFDTYMNRSDSTATVVEFRLNHISDFGYPLSQPLAPNDFFFTSNITVEAPEQIKYTVNLQIYYDNPNQRQEIYTYIPALRRSVRRSAAARCAPIVGADLVQDDAYPRPVLLNEFSYRVWGKKKILEQKHLDRSRLFDPDSYNFRGVPGWPKPSLGPWELRTVWVVEERTLPSNSSYCYGSRVTYLDEDQFLYADLDIYDPALRLWKLSNSGSTTTPLNDGHDSVWMQADVRTMTLDLLNSHATVSIQIEPARLNGEVPEKYRDVQVWALPAGLPQMSP